MEVGKEYWFTGRVERIVTVEKLDNNYVWISGIDETIFKKDETGFYKFRNTSEILKPLKRFEEGKTYLNKETNDVFKIDTIKDEENIMFITKGEELIMNRLYQKTELLNKGVYELIVNNENVKRVVKRQEQPKELFYFDELSDGNFIGGIDNESKEKYQVIINEDEDEILCLSADSNFYCRCNSLESFEDDELYVFKTKKELYKWLAE